jgi:beta-lactamase class A
MLALFGAIDAGRFTLDSRLHVRNRFLSLVDGTPFRVAAGRDADKEVHASIGKTMRIGDLARHMIITSSNLATNLLVDLIKVDQAQEMLARHGIRGVELARGVEDDKAFEANFNNRVTANGLVALFRVIYERRGVLPESAREMLDILFEQQFRSGIPAGLPSDVRSEARIANKTGEISMAAHDAGLVFLADRKPYVLAVLTETEPNSDKRMERIARVSTAVYKCLTDE